MIGRDYFKFGKEKYIVSRFGDGQGFPFKGPSIKVKFLSKKYLAVIDVDKNVHIQNVSGPVEMTLCSEKARLAMVKEKELEVNEADALGTAEGEADWAGAFMKKNNKDKQVNVVNWEQSYISINANDVCPIPMSKNFGVADFTNCIKFIHKSEYYFDKSIGQAGEDAGSFSVITGIDCFKVGFDVIFCVCEAGARHRVQLISENGRSMFALGEFGPALGQFRNPCAISAANCFNHWPDARLSGPNNPKWYKDFDSAQRLKEYLESEAIEPGSFYVSQRIREMGVYDLVYVNYDYTFLNIVMRTIIDNDAGGHEKGMQKIVLDTTIGVTDNNKYNSVWDLIKTFYGLRIPDDGRPYILIAVCDRDNLRIQIFRYYWVKSAIFLPSFEPFLYLGGTKNMRCQLNDPVSCAYATSGELAVCDMGAKTVLVFSPCFELLRSISMNFSNPNYLQLAESKFQLASYISSAYDIRNQKAEIDNSVFPCSVSFSPDGRLAVAYKNGGLVVYSGFKTFAMGNFVTLPDVALHKIVGFSSFTDVENMRNCCRYLHNFTRRKRFCWDVYPLRRDKFDSALFLFWKYAKKFDGLLDGDQQFLDMDGRPVCERKLRGLCSGSKSGCSHSHNLISNIDFDPSEMKQIKHLHLDMDSYLTIINALFGAKFFWSCERFVEELFRAHSVEVIMTHRHDPMSRANETLRTKLEMPTSVLTLYEYLALMTVCEEDYRGAKPFHTHPLFAKTSLEKFVPRVSYDEEYVKDVFVASKDASKNYNDAIKDGIKVAVIPNKSRLYVTVKDVNEETRKEGDETEVHIATFRRQSDRVGELIGNLFK